ncbi:MAG: hypothetical protein VX498_10645 [Myxococcota bacterium]|nr:hypothetical protein [Myxococcota bacterium]
MREDRLSTPVHGRLLRLLRAAVGCLVSGVFISCPAGGGDSPDPPDPALRLELPAAWDWCPEPSEASGGGGAQLLVGSEALYCATFDEERELEEELRSKALLRLVAGGLEIPTEGEGVEVTLPVCLELEAGQPGPVTAGPGTVDVEADLGGSGRFQVLLSQALAGPEGESWELVLVAQGPSEDLLEEKVISLDGEHLGLATEASRTLVLQLCEGSCETSSAGWRLDSCRFDRVRPERHRVEFEGGYLETDLRIGSSLFLTQPALFTGARGELDGFPFEQRDYWSLGYNPIHHHFSRDFAVLLDAPSACGLVARNLDPLQEAPPATVSLVDCNLAELEQRAVLSESWSRLVD